MYHISWKTADRRQITVLENCASGYLYLNVWRKVELVLDPLLPEEGQSVPKGAQGLQSCWSMAAKEDFLFVPHDRKKGARVTLIPLASKDSWLTALKNSLSWFSIEI